MRDIRRGNEVYAGGRAMSELSFPTNFEPPASPVEVVRGFDRLRRERLVRILALGVGILALILVPSALVPVFDGVSLVALLIAAAGCGAAYVVNRLHHVTIAGYLLLAGGTLGIAWVIAARAVQQGLTPTDLRLYDFFVLPIVLSGVISSRRAPIIFGALTCTFTLLSLVFLRHSPDLQLYWDGRDPQTLGSVYDVIAIPIVIQGLTAVAAWLGADSVRRSLLSAMRADELALANERIVAQANELELQRRRLRDGIVHMQEVHTAFARGNFDVRARLGEDELQPLAVSLNMLLNQMQRLQREQEQRVRIEQAAHELALALRRMRMGGVYQPPQYTGTAFDEVLLEMVTAFQRSGLTGAPPTSSPSSPSKPSKPLSPDQGRGAWPSYPWLGRDNPGTSRG